MSAPDRPDNLPADAEWEDDDQEWVVGCRDADGKYHGLVQYYRPDGTLVSNAKHDHGVVFGEARRFHPNGQVSQIANYVDGKLHGVREWFACDEPTPEIMHTPGMSREIVHAKVEYKDNRALSFSFFLADGTQVEANGTPVKIRPAGVPEGAIWNPKTGCWVAADWDDKGDRVGELRMYLADGTLHATENYRDNKANGPAKVFRKDGSLLTSRTYLENKLNGPVQYFHENGQLARSVDVEDGIWVSALKNYNVDGALVRVQEPPDISLRAYTSLPATEAMWFEKEDFDNVPVGHAWSPQGLANLIALGWCGDEDRDALLARWARRVVRGFHDDTLKAALVAIGLDRAPRLMTTVRAIRLVGAMDDVPCVDAAFLRAAMVDAGGVGAAVGLGEGGALALHVLRRAMHSKGLHLSGVEDGRLPTELRILADVEELHAPDAGIEHAGDEVADLIQLRTLKLGGNPIKSLSPELARLNTLRYLHLDRCRLEKVPEVVMNIPSIETLNLGSNLLTKLPDSFGDIRDLKTLWLHDNPLTGLPDTMPELTNLEFLHLTNHPWSVPPSCIWEIESLKTLWLVSSNLTHLPEDLGRLKNLRELSIWYSGLTSLPDALFEMTQLEEIRVRNNPLPDGVVEALQEALPNCKIF